MAKRITEEQKAEINRLSQNPNFTQKEIAQEVGCSLTAVRAHSYREEKGAEEEIEEDDGQVDAIAALYDRMLEMKNDHIKDLKDVIGQLMCRIQAHQ